MTEYYLAAFDARSQTMRFYDILYRYGIRARVVDTPPEIQDICSVSVMFYGTDLCRVRALLEQNSHLSLKGIYRCLSDGWRNHITKVL